MAAGRALALIVEPLDGGWGREDFAEEVAIRGTLSALGALQEQDCTILLHADAATATIVAMGGLDLRPAVPLESPSEPAGARVLYIPLVSPIEGLDEEMLMMRPDESAASVADILASAGLFEPLTSQFGDMLRGLGPKGVIALTGPQPSERVESALAAAEAYAREFAVGLRISGPRKIREPWTPIEAALSAAQQETQPIPIPSEDGGFGAGDTAERVTEEQRRIEARAMQVARVALAIERTILKLLS